MVRHAAPWILTLLLCACSQPERPNVLVVLVDDLGWSDVGFNNPDTFYETPVLDSLAARSLVFSQGYAAAPVCSPTRAGILSGKHPVRLRMTDFLGARTAETVLGRPRYPHSLLPANYRKVMLLEEVTLAEALREAGYATFFAGKWHLGPEGFGPEEQGFDINRGGWMAGAPTTGNKYFSPYANPHLDDGPAGEHLPDRLAHETIAFVDKNRDGPFFAYLSFYSVHTPLMTRDDLMAKYSEKALLAPPDSFGAEHSRKIRLVQNQPVYAGMVESVDLAVGQVLASLQRHGLSENTMIVFVSDNGGLSTSEGHPTSNLPLRAGKGWLYEGGVRVPMFIHWPGAGRTGFTRTPATSHDLYPTILEAAGVSVPRQGVVDGISLIPLLRGAGIPDRALWWHYPHYSHQGGPPASSIRVGDLKYIEYYENGVGELYDLAIDPGEATNLASGRPSDVLRLRSQLFRYLDILHAEFPTLNPNHSDPQQAFHPRVTDYRPFRPLEENPLADLDATLDEGPR